MDLSKCRLRLRELINEEVRLLNIFIDRRPLIKGTVYLMKTKCGKKGCKCERVGQLHTAWRFSRSQEGKTQAEYLSKKDVLRYKRLTQNYRRFRRARARLVKIHQEQIKLLNFLEEGLRGKGKGDQR